jgi:hypothetical protein
MRVLDVVDTDLVDIDVVLVGDVFYEQGPPGSMRG